jgi:predicted enzyme related to lactoylglutathione lyase
VTWRDLTVPNAEETKRFYESVVGWTVQEVDMGDYADFSMCSPETGEAVAGVCHARGMNADFPPHWLPYITVADLDESLARCGELGGKVVVPPRDLGAYGHICVIQDPAGAYAALVMPPEE